mmetsp:Transcript_37505/g.67854  ORF Transcript_37505/g.67854 Transcript_37505/m.67854 type:complete len:250 (+) Transcript_37505:199-948(+)
MRDILKSHSAFLTSWKCPPALSRNFRRAPRCHSSVRRQPTRRFSAQVAKPLQVLKKKRPLLLTRHSPPQLPGSINAPSAAQLGTVERQEGATLCVAELEGELHRGQALGVAALRGTIRVEQHVVVGLPSLHSAWRASKLESPQGHANVAGPDRGGVDNSHAGNTGDARGHRRGPPRRGCSGECQPCCGHACDCRAQAPNGGRGRGTGGGSLCSSGRRASSCCSASVLTRHTKRPSPPRVRSCGGCRSLC